MARSKQHALTALTALTAALATVALGSSTASAGGFLVSKIGGDSAGPTRGTPAAVFWNPASLGRIDGTALWVDTNLYYRSASYTRVVSNEFKGQAQMGTFSAQPALAAVTDLGLDDWTFALGVYAPFGSGSTWDDPHGPQRYQAIFGRITSLFVTPTAVYTPIDGLHLGAGVSVVRASVQSYRALDLGEEISKVTGNTVPAEQPGNEGRALLDFAGYTWAYTLGLTVELDPVVLALSYTSSVDIDLPGHLSVYVPRNDFFLGLTGGDVKEPARFEATWPRAIRGGAEWQITERFGASLAAEWVQWSQYDKAIIDVAAEQTPGLGDLDQTRIMGYRDTLNLRVGGSYQLSPSLGLFAGIGGENGAVRADRVDPSLFDALKGGGGVGARWQMTEHLLLTTSYSHVIYAPTFVSNSAVTPTPTGVHTQQAGILNTNLTITL